MCSRWRWILCCGILCIVTSFLNSAREVIETSLPQQDYVASLSSPPGGVTTARSPSTFFFTMLVNCRKLCRFSSSSIIRFKCNSRFYLISIECDQKFVSTPEGQLNGTFHAPTLINPEGDPRQCVYTFLAGPRQRVELIFTSFGLRGKPPEWVSTFDYILDGSVNLVPPLWHFEYFFFKSFVSHL